MFLQPKKLKHRKVRKGTLKKLEFKTNKLNFGTVGLKSETAGMINAKQLESARRVITRKLKRKGKVWIRVFPNLPITSKPNESRMGKGKGSVSHWVARVGGGNVIFEICGVPSHIAVEALKSAIPKLPVKTRIFD